MMLAANTMTFDTHAYVKHLTDAGFAHRQAEALMEVQKQSLTEVLDEHFATKEDIRYLDEKLSSEIGLVRSEIDLLRTTLTQKIGDLRTELKQDITDLRTELKQDITDLRTEFKQDIADLRTEVKSDIHQLEKSMTDKFHQLETGKIQNLEKDVYLMQWMIRFLLAGVVSIMAGTASLIIKVFAF